MPYLERANGRDKSQDETSPADYISIEKPPEGRISTSDPLRLGEETVLAFALKDQEVAEYHYRFYHFWRL